MSNPSETEIESSTSTHRMPANKRKRLSVSSSLSILRPSTTPSLDDLTLEHILNGETCHPISFNDFAGFTANKEFTSENLLFVLWFRSYRNRFDALPVDKRAKVPVPSTRLGDRYRPFAYLTQERRDTKADSSVGTPTPNTSFKGPEHAFGVCDWAAEDAPGSNTLPQLYGKGLRPSPMLLGQASILRPTLPAGAEYDPVEDQPMREEAIRAFSTFLKKTGSRELGISDELREFAKTCLQRSTAPEVVSRFFYCMVQS